VSGSLPHPKVLRNGRSVSDPHSHECGRKYTLTGLDMLQRQRLGELIQAANPEEQLFADKVTVYTIDKEHNLTDTKEEMLTAYVDGFAIGEKKITIADVQGMAIVSRNFIILHIKGMEGHIEIKSDVSFSALKYLYLFEMKHAVQ